MSAMRFHARRELELIGEDEDTIQKYLKVIDAFTDMGHSGGSASVAIPVIHALLQQKNLSPLTDDPNEWINHAPPMWDGEHGVWQNSRDGEAFSTDGGKTYTLLSERTRDPETGQLSAPIHQSIHKEASNG